MSKENEDNVNDCTVDLKLYSQNGFHPGFWTYCRKGIGRVVKCDHENIFFVKVIILSSTRFV